MKNEVNGQGDKIAQRFFGKEKRIFREDVGKAGKQRIIAFAENLKREETREKEFSCSAEHL